MGLTNYQDFGQRRAQGPAAAMAESKKNANYLTADRPKAAYCDHFHLESRVVHAWTDPMLAVGRPEHESMFVDDKTPMSKTGSTCYRHVWRQLMDPHTDISFKAGTGNLSAIVPTAKNPKCDL